jgi:P27 family predicted phage terminase small subunit
VAELASCGIVDRVDLPMLEQLAMQYARIKTCQKVIREIGYFARGSTGQVREHPAVKIERESTALFMKIATQYGMTAVARTVLGLAEALLVRSSTETGTRAAPRFRRSLMRSSG